MDEKLENCICGENSEVIIDSQFPIALCQDCFNMLKDGLSLRVNLDPPKRIKDG
jgi:hypothetical protein